MSKRVTLIVLDSFGVGELPDAADFDDVGAATFQHIYTTYPDLKIPNMAKLGIFSIPGLGQEPNCETEPLKGSFGKCKEVSKAKDTTNGHFEISGLVVKKPFKVFGNAFPDRIIKKLEEQIGREVIGNYPASGTEIIQVLGDEHVKTGKPIVYLSADSLMQIAMHEEVIPLEEQYRICMEARKILSGDDTVSRVICRPFLGGNGQYYRTENRRDFSVDPPGWTILDQLSSKGKDVIAIGKIEDIFNHRGITEANHTKNNKTGIDATIEYLKNKQFDGLMFVNLVDFDMLYGHRRNVKGYADALEYFDAKLPEIEAVMNPEDILIITADHGCDPTFKGTDHTREYIPLMVYGKELKTGVNLGVRSTYADIAETISEFFGCPMNVATSFYSEIRSD